MTFRTLADSAQKLIGDNSPLILTGIGVAGVVTTAVLTGKATIKAVEEIDWAEDLGNGATKPIDRKEKLALVWKLYIPPSISAVTTISAIVLSHKIGTRRAAAMAGAYALSQKAFEEYRDKVVDKIGEHKERAVRDDINQDRLNEHPITENTIVVTDGGNALCLEPMSMRYFNSSMEELKKAQNDLNHHILAHQYGSLTDLYNLIGLDRTQISDELGWNSDKLLEMTFTSGIASDGRPCLVMNYYVQPVRDYDKVH